MKKREWNEEQLEQLVQKLPAVKDTRSAEDIYQNIKDKQQLKKNSRRWIAPALATVAALLLFVFISPSLFHNATSYEESVMDSAATENSVKLESGMSEAKLTQEKTFDIQDLKNKEPETFVTKASEEDEIITVGFTDGNAQNILPISLEANQKQEKLEQLEEVNPELFTKELGPISYELRNTEFIDEGNPEEITIEYKGEPSLASSATDTLYQNALIETFRWLDFKRVKLYTNNHAGIDFGHSGSKKDLEVKQENKKAYFLYQFDEHTSKLLVPSPESYASIETAIEAMKQGMSERHLQPTIMKGIEIINIKENDDQLEVEFRQDIEFQDSEPYIIMLESILLSAKEFGYRTVQFKGMNIDQVGVMDVTKPIEVPFSPNPIDLN